MFTIVQFFKSNSISRKILTSILVISSLVTLFITITQLSFDYFQETSAMNKSLELIEKTHAKTIATSLWGVNEDQLKIELDGIISIPGINFAQVTDANNQIVISSGTPIISGSYIREIPLNYQKNNGENTFLGKLILNGNTQYILEKLFNKILLIFVTQLFKTLLVSFFIYILIQKNLTKPLIATANYLQNLKLDSPNLNLNRTSKNAFKNGEDEEEDELEMLVKSINLMKLELYSSYKKLNKSNIELEEKVDLKTKQVIEQRKKLEYSARMSSLGEMAAGIAHEINNPLTIIRSTSSKIKRKINSKEFTQEEMQQHCEVIEKTVTRISKIISGLLNLSRDSSMEDLAPCTIKELFEDVLPLCHQKFKNNDIKLYLDLENEIFSQSLLCRRIQLAQVILNIFNNASDAIENLPEKWIKVEFAKENDNLLIRIIDSGKGIPTDIQEKIMHPFFTTKEIGKGTGLGLSLSRSIILNHKGNFYIDNSNKNTCFVISLPLKNFNY